MLDGDFAGREAALKTGQVLLQQGLNVYIIQLPNDMDPDEYIVKYGKEEFLNFVATEKKSFIVFKYKTKQDEIQHNDLAYERYLKEAIQDVAFVQSNILKTKLFKM